MQGPQPQGQYGQSPQGQYASPQQAYLQQPYGGPGPSGSPGQQQPPYGGPPPQQGYQGPPGPAPQYSSFPQGPGQGPPGQTPPGHGPPGQGLPSGPQGPASGVGTKRPLEGGAEAPDAKRQEPPGPPETVLRLLVPVKRVGAVIGKHGSVIKEIKDTTGCRMRIIESIPGAEERVVVISAHDEQGKDRNAAELGLFEVHRRVIEGEQPIQAGAGAPQGILTRMLVCHSQAGSIIGKSGVQIKAIRDMSGSHIKILPPDELPPCALSNDRVVQMVGAPEALARALGEVSKIIRNNPPKELPGGCPPSLSALTGMPPGPQACGTNHGPPHMGGYHQPLRAAAHVSTSIKDVLVPDGQVGSIIGSGGSNINRIREASGCRIKVHDPNPTDPANRTIECQGTADQIAAAERLLEPYQTADGNAGATGFY